MKGSYLIGTIRGIRIEINISWLAAFLLISATLATGFFPARYPDWGQDVYWILGSSVAILMLLSIIAHELSHSLVANRLGVGVKRITLFIFGGIADLEKEPDSPRKEFLVAIAGPLMSLVLVVVFRAIGVGADYLQLPEYFSVVFLYLSSINLVLAVFNMFPAFPLDGGRVLRAAIWHFTGNLHKATRIASTIGQWFGYFLMFIGLTNMFYGNLINGLWILFIGYFVVQASQSSYQNTIVSDIFSRTMVGEFMTREVVSIDRSVSVSDAVDEYFFRYKFNVFPVMDEGDVTGIITIDNVKGIPKEEWGVTTVGAIATEIGDVLRVSPDETVSNVVSKIFSNNIGRVLVMEEDSLVGIVSRTDIMNHLRIYMQLNNIK
ncbi:MAG: site-2 protease family protein [Gudongella sp.]|nr:site-2 protease family protein [Gudongella sp.]